MQLILITPQCIACTSILFLCCTQYLRYSYCMFYSCKHKCLLEIWRVQWLLIVTRPWHYESLVQKKMKGFCVLFENSKNIVSEVCCLAVVLGIWNPIHLTFIYCWTAVRMFLLCNTYLFLLPSMEFSLGVDFEVSALLSDAPAWNARASESAVMWWCPIKLLKRPETFLGLMPNSCPVMHWILHVFNVFKHKRCHVHEMCAWSMETMCVTRSILKEYNFVYKLYFLKLLQSTV